MDAAKRREAILLALREADSPVSAGRLAQRFGVSRQIIVGDVALLRAGGEQIAATPRGYVVTHESPWLVRTVACRHSAQDMARELNLMVDQGCFVRDVIVEHPLYGQLTGQLALKSRFDVEQFAARAQRAEAAPLCALTDGVHLHTLLCPDEDSFLRVRRALHEAGLLFSDPDAEEA